MDTENPRPARGCFSSVLKGLIVAVIIALALRFGVDALFHPWSVPMPGQRALGGEWFGEVLTATGKRQYLALTLVADTGRCTAPCSRLSATAQLCEPKAEREYSGLGDVENWRGSQFHVTLSPDESAPVDSRQLRLNGNWDGETIQGLLLFGALTKQSVATVSETRPGARMDTERLFPVPLTLRRGSQREFLQACRRLDVGQPARPN